jgi:hypothetical protein
MGRRADAIIEVLFMSTKFGYGGFAAGGGTWGDRIRLRRPLIRQRTRELHARGAEAKAVAVA